MVSGKLNPGSGIKNLRSRVPSPWNATQNPDCGGQDPKIETQEWTPYSGVGWKIECVEYRLSHATRAV